MADDEDTSQPPNTSGACDALAQLIEAEKTSIEKQDQRGLAEAYLQRALLLIGNSPRKAIQLCASAEEIYRNLGLTLKAFGARLILIQGQIAQGQTEEARVKLDECKLFLNSLEGDDPDLHRLVLRLEAELQYLAFIQGKGNLMNAYEALLNLVKHLEAMRRIQPHAFGTILLFGRLDVYDRLVAVAYQLGLIAQAANWAERTKSRRLLDLLLNLPFESECHDR